jgi:hypothetical protein
MNIFLRITLISISLMIESNICTAQIGRIYRAPDPNEKIPYEVIQGMFRDGINVILEIDSAYIKWEIDRGQMESQSQLAIENSGWAYNPSSLNIVQVKIDSTQNTKENHRTFRIELTQSLDELPIQRTVEMQKGDNKLISSVVYQMVYKAGIKSRNQLLKEMSRKRNPEVDPYHGRQQLYLPPDVGINHGDQH